MRKGGGKGRVKHDGRKYVFSEATSKKVKQLSRYINTAFTTEGSRVAQKTNVVVISPGGVDNMAAHLQSAKDLVRILQARLAAEQKKVAGTTLLQFVLPSGVSAGTRLDITAPDGRVVKFTVPPGLTGGQTIDFSVPVAQEQTVAPRAGQDVRPVKQEEAQEEMEVECEVEMEGSNTDLLHANGYDVQRMTTNTEKKRKYIRVVGPGGKIFYSLKQALNHHYESARARRE